MEVLNDWLLLIKDDMDFNIKFRIQNKIVESDDYRKNFIKEQLTKKRMLYFDIEEQILQDVFLLFLNKYPYQINENLIHNSTYILYVGRLCQFLNDKDDMVKYYKSAVELNNTNAMIILGNYYAQNDGYYENVVYYASKAVNSNNNEGYILMRKYIEHIKGYIKVSYKNKLCGFIFFMFILLFLNIL
jgi:hypothetical protein